MSWRETLLTPDEVMLVRRLFPNAYIRMSDLRASKRTTRQINTTRLQTSLHGDLLDGSTNDISTTGTGVIHQSNPTERDITEDDR